MLCRHCERRKANPPRRGLCWTCRRDPAVLALHPSTSKYAPKQSGWVAERIHVPPAVAPTTAKPGTPEKVAVLAERFAAETDLWHEDDAGWG